MFERRGESLRNVGLCAVVATSVLAGCSSMPAAGEGEREYAVGFPRHPALMLFQAGNYEIERGKEFFEIKGNHWLFGERGSCRIYLPKGARNIGYDVTQGVLNNNLWVGYDLDGKRSVRKYEVEMGAGNAKLEDEFPVVWDEERKKYKRKGK
ncbi:hypothetical protein CMI45_01610 [Candidatus Pacearchaeota archaeon]|jgi:hypothetical protein|nr:hypothetical protein [Candidatus Pacearchaeota archaeon]|tara:strand:- start:1021 stop:1476 length:456 start_codon:yes stop_codon:yes gene_type:complete